MIDLFDPPCELPALSLSTPPKDSAACSAAAAALKPERRDIPMDVVSAAVHEPECVLIDIVTDPPAASEPDGVLMDMDVDATAAHEPDGVLIHMDVGPAVDLPFLVPLPDCDVIFKDVVLAAPAFRPVRSFEPKRCSEVDVNITLPSSSDTTTMSPPSS